MPETQRLVMNNTEYFCHSNQYLVYDTEIKMLFQHVEIFKLSLCFFFFVFIAPRVAGAVLQTLSSSFD